MKTTFRKTISILMIFAIFASFSLSASATEYSNQRSINLNGTVIYVQMEDGSLCTWSNENLYALLDGLTLEDGMMVTIGGINEAEGSSHGDITPYWYESWTNTLIEYSAEKTRVSDMLFSVARGQTITLTKSYSASIDFKLTGDTPFNLSSIKAEGSVSASYTYQRSESYAGPGDSTPYNTRAFYVKHYYRDETWEQTEYDFALRPQGTMRTTAERPLRSISFSVDSREIL